MKQPIAWHESTLGDFRQYAAKIEQQAKELRVQADRYKAELDFREQQIAAAKAAKMDGYDAEKFLKARKPKHP